MGDFWGKFYDVKVVVESGLDVFVYNVEMVEGLILYVCDRRVIFRQSLSVLKYVKDVMGDKIIIKMSMMFGFGEQEYEVMDVFKGMNFFCIILLFWILINIDFRIV